ncbi:MAG: hypothetical protein H7281_07035 [Bacteriovorax sp.]|nr:hypothetical protein [Bacteriovorax sp.]
MKSLFYCMVVISLCSCGRSANSEHQEQSAQAQLISQSAEQFSLPKLNLHRVVTIDNNVTSFYEDMTINSKKEDVVLGDNAFYIMINENTFPSFNEVHLNFYNKTKVRNIFYIDTQNSPLRPIEISKENLQGMKLKEVTEFYKDGLVWGKHNQDNPENDMLNKAYVVRTEEIQLKGNVEFKSQSMYLIWIECFGDIKAVNDYAYSCSKYNLKFHYKLLDYSLNSNKI